MNIQKINFSYPGTWSNVSGDVWTIALKFQLRFDFWLNSMMSQAYSELCQTSTMEQFAKFGRVLNTFL